MKYISPKLRIDASGDDPIILPHGNRNVVVLIPYGGLHSSCYAFFLHEQNGNEVVVSQIVSERERQDIMHLIGKGGIESEVNF